MKKRILIVCLRRSGSTILWKVLRSTKIFFCLDEPFNPMLYNLPKVFLKKTNYEFIDLFHNDPEFIKKFSPIELEEEIKEYFSDKQKKYLKYLLNLPYKNILIDSTRIVFKIKELYNLSPNVYLIHLFRVPQAFVSSHIIPNRPELKNESMETYNKSRVTAERNKRNFWTLTTGFNDWGYEYLTKLLCDKMKISLCENVKKRIKNPILPAYIKLLILWKLSFESIEEEGRKLFKERFISLPFEIFALNPKTTIIKLLNRLNIKVSSIEVEDGIVHSPRLGLSPKNPLWYEAFDLVGINIKEIYDNWPEILELLN